MPPTELAEAISAAAEEADVDSLATKDHVNALADALAKRVVLVADCERYRWVLANIAGQNSGIWGVMAHDALTGKHQEHFASSGSGTSRS